MKKPFNLIIYLIVALLVLLLLATLVWGKTWKMAQANQLLLSSQPKQAQAIYEELAAGSPESPYILHNLGLAFYKQEQYDKAVANLSNALKKMEAAGLNSSRTLTNRFCYNLGNALFKLAEKSPGQQAGQNENSYQTALENYQKAIGADRSDFTAKYNYELTKIRLKQAENKPSPPNQQNSQDQKEQPQNKPAQNTNGQKPDQASKNQSAQGAPPKQQKGAMTKEEAQALLKMMKSQDQSKAPVISSPEAPPNQNW
jgi:tetratricopeptide (TPR) repeat protein